MVELKKEAYCTFCKTTNNHTLSDVDFWTCSNCYLRSSDKDLNKSFLSLSKDIDYKKEGQSLPKDKALKFDQNKPRMELLDTYALEQIALVMTFGAKKYDSWNWKNGFKWSRLIGAALRHLLSFAKGEDIDPESGLSHLAHAGCCIMFLLWHSKYKPDLDDRFKDAK